MSDYPPYPPRPHFSKVSSVQVEPQPLVSQPESVTGGEFILFGTVLVVAGLCGVLARRGGA